MVSAISSGVPSRPIGISGDHEFAEILDVLDRDFNILCASSSLLPGSIFVSWMSAGAIPLTVMPFLAYAFAAQ